MKLLKLESGRAVRMQGMMLVRPEWWQVRTGEQKTIFEIENMGLNGLLGVKESKKKKTHQG